MNNGKYGEQLFQQIMLGRNNQVEDVSANPNYYYKGDFIVTSPTGEQAIFEVKWDERINKTNNLYLEIINTNSNQALGWFESCSADFLAYGDAVKQKFYIFNLKELREQVAQLKKQYGYCGRNSVGLLVNLKSVKDLILLTLEGEKM